MRVASPTQRMEFEASKDEPFSELMLEWLKSGMQGNMPTSVRVGERNLPFSALNPTQKSDHLGWQEAYRSVGASTLLKLHEVLCRGKSLESNDPSNRRRHTPPSTSPAYPPRPRSSPVSRGASADSAEPPIDMRRPFSQPMLDWLKGGKRGNMPVCVYEGDRTTPLSQRSFSENHVYQTLERLFSNKNTEELLAIHEKFIPKPPHIALEVEPSRPAPRPAWQPTFSQPVAQPSYAPTPIPQSPQVVEPVSQSYSGCKQLVIGAGVFAVTAGVGVGAYYLQRHFRPSTDVPSFTVPAFPPY